jgi:hypothetical protein
MTAATHDPRPDRPWVILPTNAMCPEPCFTALNRGTLLQGVHSCATNCTADICSHAPCAGDGAVPVPLPLYLLGLDIQERWTFAVDITAARDLFMVRLVQCSWPATLAQRPCIWSLRCSQQHLARVGSHVTRMAADSGVICWRGELAAMFVVVQGWQQQQQQD